MTFTRKIGSYEEYLNMLMIFESSI